MAVPLPSPVTATPVTPIDRIYPNVGTVIDFAAQQSLRLAWDRIHALEERLKASQATIVSLTTALNSLIRATGQIQVVADQAYAKTQQP